MARRRLAHDAGGGWADKIVLVVRFRAKFGMTALFLDRLNQLVQTISPERVFEGWRQGC
jgi:hypothetical protein